MFVAITISVAIAITISVAITVTATSALDAIEYASYIVHVLLRNHIIDIIDHLVRRVLEAANEDGKVSHAVELVGIADERNRSSIHDDQPGSAE